MKLEVKKLLFDIHQAIELIVQFTAGKQLSDYSSNDMLRSAVERQDEIVWDIIENKLPRLIQDIEKIELGVE
jgi:uncharacterized protein with HEPN domain